MEARTYQVDFHFHIMAFNFTAVPWPLKQMVSCPSYSLNGNVHTS